MPGPVRRRGKHLIDAYQKGLVDLSFIDASASRVLELVHKVRKSNIPDWKEGKEKADDLPEHRAIFRRAGAEGKLKLQVEKQHSNLNL
jgi:beta-glucosidase